MAVTCRPCAAREGCAADPSGTCFAAVVSFLALLVPQSLEAAHPSLGARGEVRQRKAPSASDGAADGSLVSP